MEAIYDRKRSGWLLWRSTVIRPGGAQRLIIPHSDTERNHGRVVQLPWHFHDHVANHLSPQPLFRLRMRPRPVELWVFQRPPLGPARLRDHCYLQSACLRGQLRCKLHQIAANF